MLSCERRVLVVDVFAIFMTVIDGTMVDVALPTMARDFGVEPSDIEWIAVGYLLAVASSIPATVGLVLVPGIVAPWFVRDDAVVETRVLAPVATATAR